MKITLTTSTTGNKDLGEVLIAQTKFYSSLIQWLQSTFPHEPESSLFDTYQVRGKLIQFLLKEKFLDMVEELLSSTDKKQCRAMKLLAKDAWKNNSLLSNIFCYLVITDNLMNAYPLMNLVTFLVPEGLFIIED